MTEEGEATATKRAGEQGDVQAILRELKRRDQDEILTSLQVAEIAGVTQQTVFNWIKRKSGGLKATKPGREWRIRVGDLVDFLTARGFRDGDRDGERVESADVHTAPAALVEGEPRPLTLLHFVPQAATRLAEEASKRDASSTLVSAHEAVARLLDFAELAHQWRRTMLTLFTARESRDESWERDCVEAAARLEADMLRACGLVSERMLTMVRLAAEEANAASLDNVQGGDSSAGASEEEVARRQDEEFERMKDTLAGVYGNWLKATGSEGASTT